MLRCYPSLRTWHNKADKIGWDNLVPAQTAKTTGSVMNFLSLCLAASRMVVVLDSRMLTALDLALPQWRAK
jgi:hypothetical protein